MKILAPYYINIAEAGNSHPQERIQPHHLANSSSLRSRSYENPCTLLLIYCRGGELAPSGADPASPPPGQLLPEEQEP
jgi:hypothetical protein